MGSGRKCSGGETTSSTEASELARLRLLERDLVDGDLAWLPRTERNYLLKLARRRIAALERTMASQSPVIGDQATPPATPRTKPKGSARETVRKTRKGR